MARPQEGAEPDAPPVPAGAGAPTPTADALRREIDAGGTAEKVRNSDPAAAPLEADAEASGNPPTREQLQMESKARQPLRALSGYRAGGFEIFVATAAVIGVGLISVSLILG